MTEETIKALARTNKYLETLLERSGNGISDGKKAQYQRQPGVGFVEMTQLCYRMGVMGEDEADMMAALANDIDADDLNATEGLPMAKQGVYLLEHIHQASFDAVTVAEAAEIMGVSTQRVYRLLSDGKLRGVTLRGKRMVFRFSAERRANESQEAGDDR